MSALVEIATPWVQNNYPYNPDHLLQSLAWLDRLAPNSREAVRLATLTHDMERAFPGPDQPAIKLNDMAYYKAHSKRSARIVGAWLRELRADEALVKDVEALILVHEFGGWPEANLVQAADSLSFLEVNIDLFLGFARSGRFTVDDVRGKFHESYDRIQVETAKPLAKPMHDAALTRLDSLEADMAFEAHRMSAANEPPERSGDQGVPALRQTQGVPSESRDASERVRGSAGAQPPGSRTTT